MSYIIEIQFFAPVYVFKILIKEKHIKIEQYERFKKMSFRNRCIILGANGLVSLTVPIEGGREQKALIRDVKIDNSEPWPRTHLRSLVSAYSKAPFFEYYFREIEVLLNSNEKFLFDLNLKIISFLIKSLKINTSIELTSECRLEYSNANDMRDKILPKNFQKDKEHWKPKYFQVFEDKWGFQPNLSILDLLFCEGPNAANLLASTV
jgi:hypothetical protein